MTINMLKGIHRRALGITKDDQVMAPSGVVAGGDGKPVIVSPAPDTVAVFEDFVSRVGTKGQPNDTGVPLGNGGAFAEVTGDTGHGSLVVAGTNGVFRLFNTPSATAAALANTSGKGISTGLQWKGNQGPGAQSGRLRFGARVKIKPDDGGSAISRTTNRLHVFAGFTDIATFEYPAFDTGAGVISAASDYCGFMLSAGGDTGWSGVAASSTANDSGDAVVSLYPGATVNIYDALEVEIHRGAGDTGGTATFYVNGIPRGSIDSPFSPTVALAACIYAFQQDTGAQALDIDWVAVSSIRDTGL
jgi:hypothetical protein